MRKTDRFPELMYPYFSWAKNQNRMPHQTYRLVGWLLWRFSRM